MDRLKAHVPTEDVRPSGGCEGLRRPGPEARAFELTTQPPPGPDVRPSPTSKLIRPSQDQHYRFGRSFIVLRATTLPFATV